MFVIYLFVYKCLLFIYLFTNVCYLFQDNVALAGPSVRRDLLRDSTSRKQENLFHLVNKISSIVPRVLVIRVVRAACRITRFDISKQMVALIQRQATLTRQEMEHASLTKRTLALRAQVGHGYQAFYVCIENILLMDKK